MLKKKAIVSACLLGERCRYDGKTKYHDSLIEFLKDYEVIPFCPEAPLFGTPRERINVVGNNIITDSGEDVTVRLKDEINTFINYHDSLSEEDIIILKSKSPSCGLGTTPILNENGDVVKKGDGIAAKIFKQYYNNNNIYDENNFNIEENRCQKK